LLVFLPYSSPLAKQFTHPLGVFESRFLCSIRS
jgi:hypothetical protein